MSALRQNLAAILRDLDENSKAVDEFSQFILDGIKEAKENEAYATSPEVKEFFRGQHVALTHLLAGRKFPTAP